MEAGARDEPARPGLRTRAGGNQGLRGDQVEGVQVDGVSRPRRRRFAGFGRREDEEIEDVASGARSESLGEFGTSV
jgi:hypothetical protein